MATSSGTNGAQHDESDEEGKSLLSSSAGKNGNDGPSERPRYIKRGPISHPKGRLASKCTSLLLLVVLLSLAAFHLVPKLQPQTVSKEPTKTTANDPPPAPAPAPQDRGSTPSTGTKENPAPVPSIETPINDPSSEKKLTDDSVLFECPSQQARLSHSTQDAKHLQEWYDEPSREILSNNGTLEDLLQLAEFDNWGHSYHEVSKGMQHWKVRHYSQLLTLISQKEPETKGHQPTVAIYESACGIGLNLYLSLDILQEVVTLAMKDADFSQSHPNLSPAALNRIALYGNDFVPESVQIANQILNDKDRALGQVGTICQGDSTDLFFVPSDAFDLVFTGYITPLSDPLGLQLTDQEELMGRYTAMCEAHYDNNTALMEQNELAQKAQEEWYAKWVGEMIRIAKPGAPVLVEQVSYPYCQAYFDWGGVGQEFWKRQVLSGQRHWGEIDVESIEFEDDTIFRRRYHVAMRKKKRDEP